MNNNFIELNNANRQLVSLNIISQGDNGICEVTCYKCHTPLELTNNCGICPYCKMTYSNSSNSL